MGYQAHLQRPGRVRRYIHVIPPVTPTHLGRGVVDNLLCRQITLVTDQQLVDALDGVSVNLLEPLLDVVVSFCMSQRMVGMILSRRVMRAPTRVSHVVNDNDAVGSSVVRRGDRSESLLSGRVPLYRQGEEARGERSWRVMSGVMCGVPSFRMEQPKPIRVKSGIERSRFGR
jgi:hypothetical protein